MPQILRWKKFQNSKSDQAWILIGIYDIQVEQIANFGFKLDKSWIFKEEEINHTKSKLVFSQITIKLVYCKNQSSS